MYWARNIKVNQDRFIQPNFSIHAKSAALNSWLNLTPADPTTLAK